MTEQLVMDITNDLKATGNFKQYNISDINKHYLDSFQKGKYPDLLTDKKQRMSFNQYRCTVNNFLESLSKDVAMVKREDIDNFLALIPNETTRGNKAAHIKSFLVYLISNNVKNCTSKISRDLLIKLLEM
jgi:hypothetical protein